jgi:RNase P subunit RPR2
MKGKLKREAKAGDANAFQVLLDIGWATEGDRIDYLGNGAPVADPTTHHYEILPEAANLEQEDGYEDLEQAYSDDTPATVIKKSVVAYAMAQRVPRNAFDRIWEKAMGVGWPEHAEVIQAARIQIEMYRDDTPAHSVKDTTHSSRTTSAKRTFRRSPCRKCRHPYLIRQGNMGIRLQQHNCELCGTPHYSTRPGLSGDNVRLGFLELQQLEADEQETERLAALVEGEDA